ncbi:MAG: DUF3307 domain-containing protein [Patescibacteria group bacterium]
MFNFWPVLFGHWTADYLLQSKKMAVEKAGNLKVCLLHCLIYAASVGLWYGIVDWCKVPMVMVLAFISHFPIDYWSLAAKWLKLIKGRDVMDAFNRENPDPFAALIYAAVDNGMHLALLYLAMQSI